MRRLLRLLRRRRHVVVVDADAYRELTELAVYGDAVEIMAAAELRWLSLDTEE